jgi:hypothetical protein
MCNTNVGSSFPPSSHSRFIGDNNSNTFGDYFGVPGIAHFEGAINFDGDDLYHDMGVCSANAGDSRHIFGGLLNQFDGAGHNAYFGRDGLDCSAGIVIGFFNGLGSSNHVGGPTACLQSPDQHSALCFEIPTSSIVKFDLAHFGGGVVGDESSRCRFSGVSNTCAFGNVQSRPFSRTGVLIYCNRTRGVSQFSSARLMSFRGPGVFHDSGPITVFFGHASEFYSSGNNDN